MLSRRIFLALAAAWLAPRATQVSLAEDIDLPSATTDFGLCVCFGKGKGADPTNLIRRYPVAVLDSGAFPSAPLLPYGASNSGSFNDFQERYAYFGIAVNTNNPAYKGLFEELEKSKLLLEDGEKPVVDSAGPGSYFADFRNPAARKVMVRHALLIAKKPGYTGLFIDAIDSAIALENKQPESYTGLVRGVVTFYEELKNELQRTSLTRPDGRTKFSPTMMGNGGFAAFTADKSFDPLAGMTTACDGRLLIESQLLDEERSPRNEPLDFTIARLTVAAKVARAAQHILQIAFVEPRAKNPAQQTKEFRADAIACKELAVKLCDMVAKSTGATIVARVHLDFGDYVEPIPKLSAIAPLAFPAV